MKNKSGAELIADERKRQVETEGWTAEHDDNHSYGELAIAAVCYTAAGAGIEVFQHCETHKPQHTFIDPWPWEKEWDKRLEYGRLPSSTDEKRDLLIKAGALIAAEIDRLNRIQNV